MIAFASIKGAACASYQQLSVVTSDIMKFLLVLAACVGSVLSQCGQTPTTASGTRAPAQVCAGALIFEDNFSVYQPEVWQPELNLAGGRNW